MNKSILMINAKTLWNNNKKAENLFINLNDSFLRIATICNEMNIQQRIIDLNNLNMLEKNVFDTLKILNPSLVLISFDIKAISSTLSISKYVRNNYPQTKIIWASLGIAFYNPIVSIDKISILKNSLTDYIFFDNEIVFRQFFNEFFNNNKITTPGFGYKDENNNPVINPYSLNKTYIPEDYDAVDINDYLWRWGKDVLSPIYIKKQKILPVVLGIGCAHACSFCINSNQDWKKVFRIKPLDLVLKQLRILIEKYQPDIIYLKDDNAFLQKDRIVPILDLINEYELKWVGQARGEYFRDDYLNEDFFIKYFKNKCLWFGIGFETFSDELRMKLNKIVTKEQLYQAATLCNLYNVPFNPAFIYGTIEQTYEEFKNDFLKLVDFHANFKKTTFSYQLWRPYPGTVEYEKAVKAGYIEDGEKDLKFWDNFQYDYHTYNWLEPRIKKMIPFASFMAWRFFTYNSFGKYWFEKIFFKKLLNDFKKEKLSFFLLYSKLHSLLRLLFNLR